MKEKHYLAPSCSAVAVNPETIIAASPSRETMTVGGTDKQVSSGSGGKTWGEVKANTVDWDE